MLRSDHNCSLTILSSRYMVLLTKSMPMVTLYVVSNVSYMNRVIILVLPTASSPRNTSLYLERGMTAEEAAPVAGVAVPDEEAVPLVAPGVEVPDDMRREEREREEEDSEGETADAGTVL